jgi:hypothetical protein
MQNLGRRVLDRLPADPPAFWPRFRSPLQTVAVTARVGRVLGVCFGVCFITGLLSHYQYGPWSWLPEPASPVWGYRLTQGIHVTTGIATIPLILLKLWSVYPRLFAWPPVRSALHGVERLSIAVFVFSALLELMTGFINILNWYPWPWFFTSVHYALAWIVIGSLVLHIAVKLPLIRMGLSTPIAPATDHDDHDTDEDNDDSRGARSVDRVDPGVTRRSVLVASGAGSALVVATTVGATFTPLQSIALLAVRRAEDATELGVPINRTAKDASTTRVDIPVFVRSSDYRLAVIGPQPFDLDLAALEALPTVRRTFPITCVEGWSVSAHWEGHPLIDIVRRAGGDSDSVVHVESVEPAGIYNHSKIFGPQLADALLATHLNGARLTDDHGFPIRLIAPNRAGVLNTKWLQRIEIS